MKNILVAVNFNNESIYAINFAISAFPNSKITILHVDTSMQEVSNPFPEVAEVVIQKDHKLEDLKTFLTEKVGAQSLPTNIKLEVTNGMIAAQIINHCNSGKYDALVLGHRLKHNILEKLLGNKSSKIIKRVHLPVYLIPEFVEISTLKKVIVASDFHLQNKTIIQKIKQWNQGFNAFIKFIHVSTESSEMMNVEKEALIETLYEDQVAFGFEFEIIEGEDVSETLIKHATENEYDAILVIIDSPHLLNKLFKKSVSNKMLFDTPFPLIFFHTNFD